MNEKLLNRIISVAYGDASLWEKLKIKSLAGRNKEAKLLLDEYKNIAEKMHNVSMEECPEEIVKNAKLITNTEVKSESTLLFDLYSFLFRRPIISATVFSVILLALISTFIFQRPEIHQQYSKQEIEQADIEVKHSLALIAEVFKKTSQTVEKDILTDRVSKPIKESFNLVNDYIQGDNKNEKIN